MSGFKFNFRVGTEAAAGADVPSSAAAPGAAPAREHHSDGGLGVACADLVAGLGGADDAGTGKGTTPADVLPGYAEWRAVASAAVTNVKGTASRSGALAPAAPAHAVAGALAASGATVAHALAAHHWSAASGALTTQRVGLSVPVGVAVSSGSTGAGAGARAGGAMTAPWAHVVRCLQPIPTTTEGAGAGASAATTASTASDPHAAAAATPVSAALVGQSDAAVASSSLDVLPGVYEGGQKLWECAIDVVQYLCGDTDASHGAEASVGAAAGGSDAAATTAETGTTSAETNATATAALRARVEECWQPGKRVLDLGCGTGLPGIAALLRGCHVTFQDLNVEVLLQTTWPNVAANACVAAVVAASGAGVRAEGADLVAGAAFGETVARARFVSGDWRGLGAFLVPSDAAADEAGPAAARASAYSSTATSATSAGTAASCAHFDLVLSTDTLYSTDSYPVLCTVLQSVLPPDGTGIALFAAKRYYFGVGGGTSTFVRALRDAGGFECAVAAVMEDGSSNIREILAVWRA